MGSSGGNRPWGVSAHHPTGGWYMMPNAHYSKPSKAMEVAEFLVSGKEFDEAIVTVKVEGRHHTVKRFYPKP